MSKEYSPPNHPLGLLNLDETSIINLGKAVRGSPREMGLVGLVGGCTRTMGVGAPWFGRTAPIFHGWTPMRFVNWPMMVWHRVEVDLLRFWACLPLI